MRRLIGWLFGFDLEIAYWRKQYVDLDRENSGRAGEVIALEAKLKEAQRHAAVGDTDIAFKSAEIARLVRDNTALSRRCNALDAHLRRIREAAAESEGEERT